MDPVMSAIDQLQRQKVRALSMADYRVLANGPNSIKDELEAASPAALQQTSAFDQFFAPHKRTSQLAEQSESADKQTISRQDGSAKVSAAVHAGAISAHSGHTESAE
eukprot:11361-Heterococcus_DN1.PRE.4